MATLKLLGIKTDKSSDKIKRSQTIKSSTNLTKASQTLYSLDIIHSFLGDNEDAIAEVLLTFLRDTKVNMKLLSEGVFEKDYNQINQVAHRMLPMFRQLKVKECISILEEFELTTPERTDHETVEEKLQLLKIQVLALITELEARHVLS